MNRAFLLAPFLALLVAVPVPGFADDAEILDLIDELGASDAHTREVAQRALVAIGASAVPRLVESLGDESPLRRRAAAEVLGRLGGAANHALPELKRLQKDPDPGVREAAAAAERAITESNPDLLGSIPALVKALSSADVETRLSAMRALGDLGPAGATAVHELIPLVVGGDARIRAAAARALGRIGPPAAEAIGPIISMGGDADRRLQLAAHDALVGIGDASVEPLLAVIRADGSPARAWAPGVFHALAPRTVTVALAAIKDPDKRTRVAAANALEAAGPRAAAALSALVGTLEDPAGAVRRAAATALGSMGRDAADALSPLTALAKDVRRRARSQAVRAIARILHDLARPETTKPSGASSRFSGEIERGLAWLRVHQSEDGGWLSAGFDARDPEGNRCGGHGNSLYDTGVTGLALLALLSGGVAAPDETAVRAGLRHLLAAQRPGGEWTSAGKYHSYTHAICTLAMVRGSEHFREPLLRAAARRGLDVIAAARNPDAAWRYKPRDGMSDTSVTCWMLWALSAGRASGFPVEQADLEDALAWVDRVTDANTGLAGYDEGVKHSARPQETLAAFPSNQTRAMTASALIMRLEAGQSLRSHDVVRKAVEQCLSLPPVWELEGGRLDMYYWLMGTRAFARVGGTPWRKWGAAFAKAALAGQRDRKAGHAAGSWDPVDPWRNAGGRIYSTSVMVLGLKMVAGRASAHGRALRVTDSTREAVEALKFALTDEDAVLREAAAGGLALIGK